MVTKALIEKVLSKNEIKIRIPVLDKIETSDISVPYDLLPTATICSLPNFSYNLKQGDIVYVEFEDNDMGKPVILGLQKNSTTKIDGFSQSLSVSGLSKIANIVSIGNIKSSEILFLDGLDRNVKDSLDEYKKQAEEIDKTNKNNLEILDENTTKLYDSFSSIDNINKSISNIKKQIKNIEKSESLVESNITTLNNKIGNIQNEGTIADILKSLKEKTASLEDSFECGYSLLPDVSFSTIEYISNFSGEKYNSLYECMLYDSKCYRNTYTMGIVGVMWHDTGANNKTIKRYVQPSEFDKNYKYLLNLIGKNINGNDWNNINSSSCVNAFIGTLNDGSVATVQTLPWDFIPYGCGSGKNGSCNNGWIQFEICQDNKKDSDYFKKVYDEAIKLTAYLCLKFNIDPYGFVKKGNIEVPTILCHWDSYKLGMGSGHYDIYDWFPLFGKCKDLSMNDIRNDVHNLIAQKNN